MLKPELNHRCDSVQEDCAMIVERILEHKKLQKMCYALNELQLMSKHRLFEKKAEGERYLERIVNNHFTCGWLCQFARQAKQQKSGQLPSFAMHDI